MIQGWIAVTHNDWFDRLARGFQHDEVNFWNPSGRQFTGSWGAPFFFKLKAPRNAIGGFGLVGHFCRLMEWQAWDFFREKNGVASLDELQTRLDGIRRRGGAAGSADGPPIIGCTILLQAVFFPRELWVRPPADWPANVQRYMGYDLSVGEGLRVWRECTERAQQLGALLPTTPATLPGRRYSDPSPVALRLGQGSFRAAITDVYRKCAITGEGSLPVLEACHIRPFGQEGEHEIGNGLLLRSDVHTLFDRGYLTVTPGLEVLVSDRLRAEYGNGKFYYDLHGRPLRIRPQKTEFLPRPDLLAWHNENVYKG